jgi:hypothetical protein
MKCSVGDFALVHYITFDIYRSSQAADEHTNLIRFARTERNVQYLAMLRQWRPSHAGPRTLALQHGSMLAY